MSDRPVPQILPAFRCSVVSTSWGVAGGCKAAWLGLEGGSMGQWEGVRTLQVSTPGHESWLHCVLAG